MGDPPPWGPPGYPYGGPRQEEHPQGTTVLVLGICGIVLCQLLSPVAWVLGRRALAEIDAQPGRYSNRGNVQIGYICGIVGSALIGVSLLFGLAWIGFLVTAGAFSSAG